MGGTLGREEGGARQRGTLHRESISQSIVTALQRLGKTALASLNCAIVAQQVLWSIADPGRVPVGPFRVQSVSNLQRIAVERELGTQSARRGVERETVNEQSD